MEVILRNRTTKNQPTFGEVKTNQQFINVAGCLCVKSGFNSYFTLSTDCGLPWVYAQMSIESNCGIKLILPEIEKYVLPKC